MMNSRSKSMSQNQYHPDEFGLANSMSEQTKFFLYILSSFAFIVLGGLLLTLTPELGSCVLFFGLVGAVTVPFYLFESATEAPQLSQCEVHFHEHFNFPRYEKVTVATEHVWGDQTHSVRHIQRWE